MLIRAGHHLWALKRRKSLPLSEQQAIDEALETLWAAKAEYRKELKAKLQAKGAIFAAQMRERKEKQA
jgi:hypothetical protein